MHTPALSWKGEPGALDARKTGEACTVKLEGEVAGRKAVVAHAVVMLLIVYLQWSEGRL